MSDTLPIDQGFSAQQPAPAGAPIQIDILWLGALFALWVILTAGASLASTSDLAVALAWLIAVGVLVYVLDPNGVNALARVGLTTGGSKNG